VKAQVWGLLVRLLLAFALWSWVALYALPLYARVVVPIASRTLHWLRPHGLEVELVEEHPYVALRFRGDSQGEVTGRISFSLLAYNAVLYLAVVSAVPGPSLRWRLRFVAMAAPAALLFHVGDLVLAVESQVLSVVQEQHYDLWRDFGFWFSAVKFYNFLSVMAVKQVVPVGLYYVQWRFLPWRQRGAAAGS
jgi:hypothetical protein